MASKESASARSAAESGARPGLTLAAVAVVQFMVSLDLSVVNVGLRGSLPAWASAQWA